MIFVVYIAEGIIGFVSQELSEVLDYISKNRPHSVETRRGSRLAAVQYLHN